MFSKTEALMKEEDQIGRLIEQISRVTRDDDEAAKKEALQNLERLYTINNRWNISRISEFILEKQKELFY